MKFRDEWFNDEDFWEHFSPILFDEKRWAEVKEVTDGVIRFSGLKTENSGPSFSGYNALDLCCGMGRISSEFSRRGFTTTGVDICKAMLEAAQEDASYENLKVEYIHSDVRSFKRPEFFDLAVNLYISFGYFENQADDLLMVKNVYESLKPGGSFIIETLGKEIAARDFIQGEWFERAGFTVLTEFEAVNSWSALKNRWILISKDSSQSITNGKMLKENSIRVEKTYTQRLYAATELKALLLQAGFQSVELYGGWDKKPYNQDADILIAVGKK